jgi:Protein of unknown function (DUF1275)
MKKPTLPTLLSFNAGYVDAAAFLALRRLSTAHMTSNSVTRGASLVTVAMLDVADKFHGASVDRKDTIDARFTRMVMNLCAFARRAEAEPRFLIHPTSMALSCRQSLPVDLRP